MDTVEREYSIKAPYKHKKFIFAYKTDAHPGLFSRIKVPSFLCEMAPAEKPNGHVHERLHLRNCAR